MNEIDYNETQREIYRDRCCPECGIWYRYDRRDAGTYPCPNCGSGMQYANYKMVKEWEAKEAEARGQTAC